MDELKKRTLRFETLKKPDICNIIISADEDRYQWTKEDEDHNPDELLYSVVSEKISKIQDDMARKNAELREEYETRLREQAEKREAEEIAKQRKEEARLEAERIRSTNEKRVAENTKMINDYIVLFNSNTGYNPDRDEIRESLREIVDNDILEQFLAAYGPNNV
jgi:hypothetical protein